MGKYKCEYFLNDNSKSKIFICFNKEQIKDLIKEEDINSHKHIKVFEKTMTAWKLVYCIDNSKVLIDTIFENEEEHNIEERYTDGMKEELRRYFFDDDCQDDVKLQDIKLNNRFNEIDTIKK